MGFGCDGRAVVLSVDVCIGFMYAFALVQRGKLVDEVSLRPERLDIVVHGSRAYRLCVPVYVRCHAGARNREGGVRSGRRRRASSARSSWRRGRWWEESATRGSMWAYRPLQGAFRLVSRRRGGDGERVWRQGSHRENGEK